MEKYVTSLELSMRLDKLIKNKKDTMFYWVNWIREHEGAQEFTYLKSEYRIVDRHTVELYETERGICGSIICERGLHVYKAYLTDELLERLPDSLESNDGEEYYLKISKFGEDFTVVYSLFYDTLKSCMAKSLPEALGLMLEYLLVNNLI